jgi:hypothetical protein
MTSPANHPAPLSGSKQLGAAVLAVLLARLLLLGLLQRQQWQQTGTCG